MTLAGTIHVAHQAGIVHRDLKPSNVLYTWDGVPKITDFGLAKRIDSDVGHTQTGQVMGSPSYMAPEQARGHSRNVGPAADVYALGAILYEMLTGRPPFKGETAVETMRQVVDDEPVSPSRLVPRVSRDLETICLSCLQKEPARRYASAQALADDLSRWLRGEPIQARRHPLWERAAKWSRRHKVAAIFLVITTVALPALVAGGFTIQQQKANWLLAQGIAGRGFIEESRSAHSGEELNQAEIDLTTFRDRIRQEGRLRELRIWIEKELSSVKGRRAELENRGSRVAREQSERKQLDTFRELRDQARFHDTRVTGLDAACNDAATRRAAEAAFDLISASGPGEFRVPATMPASWTGLEQTEVAASCYELLLILAAAEPSAEAGLHRLDQAARLRPATTAYHLRRATCLSRAGRESEAKHERELAQASGVVTAFDHYLIGQERYKRGEWRAAASSFYRAIQLETDHFWAQCFWSVCCLQLKQFSEAKTGLNACLQRAAAPALALPTARFCVLRTGRAGPRTD